MAEMKFRVRKTAGGYDGIISVPFAVRDPQVPGASGIKATAKGPTKKAAIARAANIAEKALANPVISALLPPGAGPALKAAQMLAKSGVAKTALKYAGPAMRRLSRLFG